MLVNEKDYVLLDELLSSIDQVLFVRDALDPDLSVLYVNDAYQSSWGLSKESLYADPYSFLEVVHPEDKKMIINTYINTIKDKKELELDFRIVKSQKDIRWIFARVIPIRNSEGQVHRLIGITDDITERKERELRLSNLNKVQNSVIQMLAHDLRSPISGIKFLAKLIETKDNVEEVKNHSEQIVESCDDTLRLMDDLLSHIQVNNNGVTLNKTEFIIEEQVRMICELFKERIQLKELSLKLPKTLTKVKLDQLRFQQIITNLISNAIKFNNEKGEVLVDIEKVESELRVSVVDSGIGIPENLHSEVFELFSNAGRVGTFGEKSTGLGLSITKRLVNLHRGKISLCSAEGEGTTILMIFPQ